MSLLWDTLVQHSCRTLLSCLVAHSCGTSLQDTPVACGTLLYSSRTLVGHSSRTLLWDILAGHPCGLRDTLVRHSCGTLSYSSRTLVGHSSRTLLWDILVGHYCGTLLWDTLVGHSCGTLLRDTLFTKVNRHVSRTSVSYETSSESHMSSLQNEHFARDLSQKHSFDAAP